MNIKNLWVIIIRVIGIPLVFELFSNTYQYLIIGLFSSNYNIEYSQNETPYLLLVLVYSFMFSSLYFLIINPKIIIKILRLDKGYEGDSIDLSINKENLSILCSLLIGGYIFVSISPTFIHELISYFQNTITSKGDLIVWILLHLIELTFGLLLFSNPKWIGRITNTID